MDKNSNRSCLLLLIISNLAGACGHSTSPGGAAAPESAPGIVPKVLQAVVLAGSDKVEVTLLELDGDHSLIQLTGAEGDFFGKVIEHTRAFTSQGDTRYMTTYDGKPFVTLLAGEKEGKESWDLLTPDKRFRVSLFRDRLKTTHLDVQALLRRHQVQAMDGTLAALTRFDRRRSEQAALDNLQPTLRSVGKTCGAPLTLEMNWSSVPLQMLINSNFTSKLRVMTQTLSNICKSPPGRAFTQAHPAQRITFTESLSVAVAGKALRWALPRDITYSDGNKVLESLSTLPWKGKSLARQIAISSVEICETPEKMLVLLSPRSSEHRGVSYGRGSRFTYAGSYFDGTTGVFFEPRYENTREKKIEFKHRSSIRINRQAGSCTMRCGNQIKPLRLLTRAEIIPIFEKATFAPPQHQREPYALARDRQGIYYFVDRGTTPTTQKEFKIFIGRRGRMRAQQMKDIVADSRGEIFSTRDGDLRLVVSKTQAIWITKRGEHELLWLPVKENMSMIYNELGPYLGQRLGNPCDDF